MCRQTFAAVTAVHRTGGGASSFSVSISPDWTIGGKPNGGYLLAMLGRSALALTDHEHVVAASAHYLRAPEPGPAEVEARVLRAGRSAAQVRATLTQGGEPQVEALLTVAALPEAASAPYWSGAQPDAVVPAFDDCQRLPNRTPAGLDVPILDRVEVRLDPATLGFARGRPSGRGELRGWLALPGDDPLDSLGLLFAVDALPPATFDVEQTGWVPTLELTAYVRSRPVPGPVRVRQRAHVVHGQRVDQSCHVWDSAGHLVAHGTQLAGIRLGSA